MSKDCLLFISDEVTYFHHDSKVPLTMCSTPCPGHSRQFCGGSNGPTNYWTVFIIGNCHN